MPEKLWYKRSAEQWVEALPLGNGRIGAMVFGRTDAERIALNEDTLWSGFPRRVSRKEAFPALETARKLVRERKMEEAEALLARDFLSDYSEAYMPLGDLTIAFNHEIKPDTYHRSLDLSRAVCEVDYETVDGVRHSREIYVSSPDQALIVHLQSSKSEAIEISAALTSELKSKTEAFNGGICMTGRCPSCAKPNYLDDPNPLRYSDAQEEEGISFCALLNAVTNGKTDVRDGILHIANASDVTLVLTVRTNFAGWNHPAGLSGIPYIENASADWRRFDPAGALERHIREHQSWYNRCGIQLNGASRGDLPTDERLTAYDGSDLGLHQLLFAYGRYLLIAASRPGTQSANLQGIWNESVQPPWSSNYTTNINTEMNYWPALNTNLSELQEPLDRFVGELREAGAETAREYYHSRGFVCHHNSDLWRMTAPPGRGKRSMVHCAFWPMGSGWLATHLYEKWKFTQDESDLRNAYPVIKDAALFYLDNLRPDGKGRRIVGPCTSPENVYNWNGAVIGLAETVTMTNAILRELFADCLEMSAYVQEDDEFRNALRNAIRDLPPFAVDATGRLMEWPEAFEEHEITHRHVSHLFGLYPARQITPEDTPDLADACRQTLIRRTDASTGWSMGWKVCLWARLADGDHALKLIDAQLTPVGQNNAGGGTYPNLMDAHPPFQIDGNFGACAGLAEMLIQSRKNAILILPALPKRWSSGAAHGLRAYGGLEIDLRWEDGALQRMTLKAHSDVRTTLLLPNKQSLPIQMKAGEIKEL